MARDRRAACRSRRDSRRVADGSANLSRHTFAPSQEERRVAEATARGRLSRLQLARLATGVAGRQSQSLADRDHASKQGRHPRRGRLYEPLRQRSSKHFLPHRLRSQNPEIRGTLTNPRHRALSGRQKPRNPAVLRFLLNHPDSAGPALYLIVHMRSAAGTIPTVAVPKCDEPNLLDTTHERRVQQPQVAALEGIDALRERAQLVGHDAWFRQPRLHCVEAIAPLLAIGRGYDRPLDELGFGER